MLTDSNVNRPFLPMHEIALVVFIIDPIFVVVYNVYGPNITNKLATLSNLERNTILTILWNIKRLA